MDWLHENLRLVIGIVAGIAVVWIAVKLLSPRKRIIEDEYKLNVQCRNCKWQGVVTKYNQVCRKCASRELDVL